MSIQAKFKGKCKDCKTEFKQGATISTNSNNTWCPHGDKCPAVYSTTSTDSHQDKHHQEPQSTLSPTQLDTISKKIDYLMELEKIATAKLTGPDNIAPNPAKVGMYVKFLYDSLDIEK